MSGGGFAGGIFGPDDGAPLDEQGPDNEVRLARLRHVLSGERRFQIVLLEVPEHPIRRAVIDRVLAWSAAGEIPPLRHLVTDPAAPEETQIADRILAARPGCIVEGLDSVSINDAVLDRAMGTLNWYRDQLRELDGPLVLVWRLAEPRRSWPGRPTSRPGVATPAGSWLRVLSRFLLLPRAVRSSARSARAG